MRITIKVHTKSSQKKVVLLDDIYHVYINIVPEKGKANIEIIQLLARHFEIGKSKIHIISGLNSKRKVIEII